MSYGKRGGGLLGLLVVAVLGVMAFAASAQALTPRFNVGGNSEFAFEVTGTPDEGKPVILLVPASNLKISCPEFEVKEGLVAAKGLTATAKLLYKNCKAFEHEGAQLELPCHVSDVAGGKPELLHITASAKLLPVEFADGTYGVLAEGIVATINFLPGTGCPLPLKNVVKGEVCFRITSGNDTTSPLIRSSKAIQKECPKKFLLESLLEKEDEEIEKGIHKGTPTIEDKLFFGVNEAFVEGAVVLSGKGAVAAGKTIGVLLL